MCAARRHYPTTCLVTDDEGARLLIDGLRLPFARVSTALNALRDEDPEWWALGKIEDALDGLLLPYRFSLVIYDKNIDPAKRIDGGLDDPDGI